MAFERSLAIHDEHPFVVYVKAKNTESIIFLRSQTPVCSEATPTGAVPFGCR